MKTITLTPKDIHAGNLILVNAQHPYHESEETNRYVPVNATERTVLLERHAVSLLSMLMDELDGWKEICAVSGWRSMEEQQEIYGRSWEDHGEEYTKKFVAPPGCSEHQTGLAIDLGLRQDKIDFICPHFPYTGICQTFREKAIPFGFIERYPCGKEEITRIAHEPWHFRYVGAPHAEIMSHYNFSLEEYHEFLKQYPHGKKHYQYYSQGTHFSISYLAARADTRFEIGNDTAFSVSGNNMDGYIITEWRDQNGT